MFVRAYAQECVCVCDCTCGCGHVEVNSWCSVSSSGHAPLCFWRQEISMDLERADSADWQASETHGSSRPGRLVELVLRPLRIVQVHFVQHKTTLLFPPGRCAVYQFIACQRHFHYFLGRMIVSRAATNTVSGAGFVWTRFIFPGQILSCGTVELWGKWMFNLLRNYQESPPMSLEHFLLLSGTYKSSTWSTSLSTLGILHWFTHPGRWVVLFHCGFNMPFLNGWSYWTSFYTLLCPPDTLLRNTSEFFIHL